MKSIVNRDNSPSAIDKRWDQAYEKRESLGVTRSNNGIEIDYESMNDPEKIRKACRIIAASANRVF